MLTIALLKIIFALAIMVVVLAAGWYPFKKRFSTEKSFLDFPIGETLATGVFLGAGLLHMLPEANTLFLAKNYHYPFAFIIAGLVFLFFLWFEHLGKEFYHRTQQKNHTAFAILAWIMLSIHSLVLGAALGVNHSRSVVIMIFLAIIIHKWAESFAIAIELNKSAFTHRKNLILFFTFSLMTPGGIFLGWYFGQEIKTNSLFDPFLIAISAGTFLYLGTLHGLERCVMVERCCNLRDYSYVIFGFLLMALVAVYT